MRWIAAGLLTCLLSACLENGSNIRLSDGRWQLMELHDSYIDLPDTLRPWVEFSSSKDQFTGYGGCNHLFGAVEITGNVWAFKEIGATKMACERLVVEDDFIDALTRSNRYRQEGDRLIILRDEEELAKFKHVADESDE